MAFQFRSLVWCLALSSAALLVGCGGGSDADETAAPGNTTGNNNTGGSGTDGNSTVGNATAAAVDRFVGSFATPCIINNEVLQVSSGQPVRQVLSMTQTKVSDTQLRYVQRYDYYAPTDVECKGSTIGSSVWNKTGNTLNFGSSVTVPLGSESVSAYRVQGNLEAIGGISSGGVVVVNDLQFPGDFFIEAYDFVDLLALSADGTKLYSSDIDTEDAEGYPTALDTSFFLTRLP